MFLSRVGYLGVGTSNGAICSSIIFKMAAGRHFEKLQRHRAVSMRQQNLGKKLLTVVRQIVTRPKRGMGPSYAKEIVSISSAV